MTQYLFKNLQLLEPSFGDVQSGFEVLVENDLIREVSDKPIKSDSATVMDCGGQTLMPGLIDSPCGVTDEGHDRPRLYQRA